MVLDKNGSVSFIEHNGEKYIRFEDAKHLVKRIMKENRTIDINGWQGKDKLQINKEGTEWIVREHRKDKESGIIAQQTHIIPEINVANLWQIIKERCPQVGMKTRYREVVADIILKNHLPLGIEEFNGGLNRSKFLFPLYYYPLKVIEELKFIKYGGRGTITRIVE